MKKPAMKRPAAACTELSVQAATNATLSLEPLPAAKPDWYDAPDEKAQLAVYLVTAAKLVNEEDLQSDPPLRDPARISKPEFHAALLDSLANPVACGAGRRRTTETALDTYFGVMEGPTDAGHHHAGLRFHKQKHSFNPFKLALRQRHGIATHWSTSHREFHTIVKYLHQTSEHKPVVDRDPLVWTRDGRKLNLFDECNEPWQVKGWVANRERRCSEPMSKKQKKKERFNHLDFKALVLQENLFTPSAVLTHFQEKGSAEMQLWVSGRQRKLKELIQEAVEWGAASAQAKLEKETEWQIIERRAKDGTCECGAAGCVWWAMAAEFFKKNKRIDKERLAAAIRKIVVFGPSKDVPVPFITGDKNCAKSTVADPVIKVFGRDQVHPKPKLGAPNGAYGELAEGKVRFVYWDDYRPVDYAAIPEWNPTVPVTDFLALFQGQSVKAQVTQSFNNGHPKFSWNKGVLMTAKVKGLWDLVGNVTAEEINHMKARVDIFPATSKVGNKPEDFQSSPACPNPWCRWVVTDSIAYASRQGPRCLGSLGKKLQPLALPSLPSEAAPQGMSDEMKAKIEANRQEALKRKREVETKEANAALMAEFPDFDEVDDLAGAAGMDSAE